MTKQDILNALKVMVKLKHTVCLDNLTNCKFSIKDGFIRCRDSEGTSYTFEHCEVTRQYDLVIATIDDCSGGTITCFFDAENELSEEEFYEV